MGKGGQIWTGKARRRTCRICRLQKAGLSAQAATDEFVRGKRQFCRYVFAHPFPYFVRTPGWELLLRIWQSALPLVVVVAFLFTVAQMG